MFGMSPRHTAPVAALALLLAAGCEAPVPTVAAGGGGAGPDGDADGDADGEPDTGSEVDTGPDTGADSETGAEPDCEDRPGEPAGIGALAGVPSGPGAAMAFTGEGVLVTSFGGGFHRTRRGEASEPWVEGTGCERGLVALPTGDLVCAGGDALYLFDGATGARRTALGGLRGPGGLAVDDKGEVFVSEEDGVVVLGVNPYTGESRVVADGVSSPGAIAADCGRGVLYVNGGCDVLYRVPLGGGSPVPEPLLPPQQQPAGGDCLVELGVDPCGDLLALTAGEPRLVRIAPEERTVDEYAALQSLADEGYDLAWGPGEGGFGADALYVPCPGDGLLEILTGAASWSSTPSR